MLHYDKELPNDSGRLSSYNNFTEKSKMAAAKKQCFLRFLYFTESSPPSFKVRGLRMTMNLALVQVHISSRHSNLNFAHRFVIF